MGIMDMFSDDDEEEEAELGVPSYMKENEENNSSREEARIPERKEAKGDQVKKENAPSVDFPFDNPGSGQQKNSSPPESESMFNQNSQRGRQQSQGNNQRGNQKIGREIELILSKLDNIDQRLKLIENKLGNRGGV